MTPKARGSQPPGWTGTSCQISDNIGCHPETIACNPGPWENYLPPNQSLVPKGSGDHCSRQRIILFYGDATHYGSITLGLVKYLISHQYPKSLSLFTFMHRRRKWQPTPVFLPGESQGRGSLVGWRLWGRTESDMTEVT